MKSQTLDKQLESQGLAAAAKDWPHAVDLEPVGVARHAMADDAKEEEPEERECRICRGEGEENNPLYVPCDCRGSIRYCHEDCLV